MKLSPQTPAVPSLPSLPVLPQTPEAQIFPPGTPLDVLVARDAALSLRLDNLQGERNAFVRVIRGPDTEARTSARARVTQLDFDIARTVAEQRSVRSQIATRMSRELRVSIGREGAPPPSRGFNGDQVTAIVVVFTLAVLMPISLGLTRRLWRRGPPAPAPAQDIPQPRLDRLEQAVDAIAIEVERISEGQRFVTKVMTERPAAVRPSNAPEVAEAQGLGEAKPFLALGAGPMEPIPVQQRQAVRQSITPH